MMEWLSMGGYAGYVWPSYAVFLLVVVGGWLMAIRRGRKIRHEIRKYHTRKDGQNL